MPQKIFQKLLSSPFPLFTLGGIVLAGYILVAALSGNLLKGNAYAVIDQTPFIFLEIIKYCWFIFLISGIAVWVARQQSIKSCVRRSHWIIAIIYFLLFCVVLIVMNPLSSQDVFWNLFQGKIFTQYHQNPYLTTPGDFPEDPYLSNIPVWQDFKMTHGPVWTFIVSAASIISPNNLALQIIALRIVLFAILVILIYFLVATISRINPSWAFPAFIALSWQPLILIETIANAHNDILVGAAAIIGLFLISQKKYLKGFIFLWIGVLTKYILLLLIPLGIMLMLRRHSWQNIAKIGLKIILICSLLTLIFYFPFGYGQHLFSGLTQQAHLFNYATLSPVPFWLTTIGFNIFGIDKKGVLSNQATQSTSSIFADQNSYELVILIVRITTIAIFILGYLWLIFKRYHNNQDFIKRGFLIIALYLLVAPNWFMAWYLVWLIPLAVAVGFHATLIVLIVSALVFPYPLPAFQIIGTILGLYVLGIISISRLSSLFSSKYPKHQATSDSENPHQLKENHKLRGKNIKS